MNKKQKKPSASGQDAQSRIEQLERELLFARAENAYLKKLRALMQQTKESSGE
jgi:hypothetical protein